MKTSFCSQGLPGVWTTGTSPKVEFQILFNNKKLSKAAPLGWLDHSRLSHLSALRTSWIPFAVCFRSLSISDVKALSYQFSEFSWLWPGSIDINTSEFILTPQSAVPSSINTSEPVHMSAILAHKNTNVRHVMWYASTVCYFFFFPIVFSFHHSDKSKVSIKGTVTELCKHFAFCVFFLELFLIWPVFESC